MNVCVIILNNKHKHGHINIRFEYGYLYIRHFRSRGGMPYEFLTVILQAFSRLRRATVVSNQQACSLLKNINLSRLQV